MKEKKQTDKLKHRSTADGPVPVLSVHLVLNLHCLWKINITYLLSAVTR